MCDGGDTLLFWGKGLLLIAICLGGAAFLGILIFKDTRTFWLRGLKKQGLLDPSSKDCPKDCPGHRKKAGYCTTYRCKLKTTPGGQPYACGACALNMHYEPRYYY